MSALFKKLNLRDGQTSIAVLNAPKSFDAELASLAGIEVLRDAKKAPDFLLAFLLTVKDVESAAKAAARSKGDAVVWMAYPKQTSKNYTCEFNRDTGWGSMGAAGFEPVRIVAIDSDWSALRFRRVEFIKKLTRDPKYRLTK